MQRGIGGAPTNYRRQSAVHQKSAAAPTNCRRRDQRRSLLIDFRF